MNTRYLTPTQVAEMTGYTVKTLSMWRYEGRGPKYIKTSPGRSGRIRYELATVLAWMKEREQSGAAA
ncbi:AlpA family transcriptional regulator [Nocardiopsis sp. NRRL B-16309]|uniref:helix-turn-helix transcriptional regulator n=1 Tax=Nocardiopsis sp. NRRL B-16309 TaxID=1519494 RepID=UPI0006AEAD1F|nr:helix-turn-helix domain-containing protein [Nocardiopsis sp. NRRL B-16309]KOX10237.1 hypothetical protein ADL05_26625 [Nocardiopsis sp. NRRL B-16309]